MPYPNRNILWTSIFVDELIRAVVTDAVIAPGSRSTPLALAFAARAEIRAHSLLDERGAAFFALGLAQTSGRPAALVCTSGTAAANFFPAIVEASLSEIPMLVLTADRPPELYQSGSNQVIDQMKLYGEYPRWFMQIPLPEANPSAHLLGSLRAITDRAVAISLGLEGAPGPVHLNFPFRKPLEPISIPGDLPPDFDFPGRADGGPWLKLTASKQEPDPDAVKQLSERIRAAETGLIVCGPRCPGGDFPAALMALSAATGFPVLTDPLSNVRFGPWGEVVRRTILNGSDSGESNSLLTDSDSAGWCDVMPEGDALLIAGYDTFLSSAEIVKKLPAPEIILRFGDLPTSTALMGYLAKSRAYQVAIGASARWMDDMAVIHEVLKGDAAQVCRSLIGREEEKKNEDNKIEDDETKRKSRFVETWLRAESAAWQAVDEAGPTFEGAALAQVVEAMSDDSILYIANSLPVRHLDQFARPNGKNIRVLGNRGASGIDGTVSSALGASKGSDKPLVLVTGDLSLYHDLNGLLAAQRCDVDATIVLIHNDGGGIFQRLPVAQFEPPFTPLFVTPHGLDFAPAAQMFGLAYQRLNGIAALGPAVSAAIKAKGRSLLEIRTDSAAGEKARISIIKRTEQIFHHGDTENTEI